MIAVSLRLLFAALFLCITQPGVAQTPVTLAADGAWTWFNDPRAVFKDGLLYFGYMRDGDGKAALSVYNPAAPATAPTTLWSSVWVEHDDHNNPGLLPLQDGRLMAFYARHAGTSTTFNYRLSTTTTPSTPAEWAAEQTYTSAERISYANPIQLSAESGRIYNFMRNLNYNPTFVTTDDFGTTWSTARNLIQTGTGGTIRPYVKYASNGIDRIDFFYTDGHPRDVNNSLYHGYCKNGSLYKTDGVLLKTLAAAPLLHDSGQRGSIVYQYSTAATADPNSHIQNGRAWCWDLTYDSSSNPIATFSVQVDDTVAPLTWADDRIFYYYARWVPGTGWQKRFVAHAGRPLYDSEDDYAGGIAVDPLNPNVIYISTNAANPFNLASTTNVPLNANARYEIYRGVTADGGLTFNWQPITQNSAVDNLRPYVPRHRPANTYAYALIWFAGTYTNYELWSTQVKGLFSDSFNQPPSVSITSPVGGSANLETTGSKLRLTASATDDGGPGPLSVQWSVVSAPPGATATFTNAASADTAVTFSQNGQYVLRATASDTAATASADVAVSIGPVSLTTNSTLWLKLDESSGTTADDSSGPPPQNNDGMLNGGATWVAGKVGGAIDLNGSNGYVNVPNASSLQSGSAFTVSYWFRADTYNTAGAGLVSKRTTPTSENAFTTFLQGNSGDAAYKRINVDIDGSGDRFTSNTLFNLGTWYHVALVFDGSAQIPQTERARLYVNGVLDTIASETSATVPNYTSSLRLGLTHTGVSTWFDGKLDEVRFFQRALNGNEVAALAGTLNLAPVPSAGSAPAAVNGVSANLTGSATDDGSGGALSTLWSKVSGPGSATFGSATNPATTVLFNQPGAYTLRLQASDTQIQTSSDLVVNVSPNPNIFADWISAAFPGESDPEIIGPEADPEGDGVKSAIEFAVGLNPATADARSQAPGQPGLPTASIQTLAGGDYLTLEVRRPIGRIGITYDARVSGNLVNWSDGVQVGQPVANGDGTETLLFRDSATTEDSPRFIRLRITFGG